ncbi:hypothetical protein OUZ56_014951 [Daphnia magna]|uniref:Brain chitinase and chia n=1 Tax=Daphnia magna TaxID=35525 RepID=A0ABR0ALC0_9CRUS|nr:hypothetical protein OUZ56_014951 [Daphnia magna]
MANIRWIIPVICLITIWSSVMAQRPTAKAVSPVSKNNKRVVCYYANWSAYRPGQAKFLPQNINPYLCTHLIYAFGGFTNDFTLRPFDKWQDIDQGGYAKFNGLKAHNKNLRTLLAIGGWNEGSARFSKLVADPETRQNLVRSAIKYLRQHQFDGLDLDWEYPASREGSKPADRENYAQLVKELRDGFNNEKGNRERLLLTMAVPAGVDTIELGFDIRSLNRDLDFINILSYDYHVATEPQVNHHAPLRARSNFEDVFDPNEELNIDSTVQIYLLNGASADKLVLGIPTYGRSFRLVNPDMTELGSPADGPAEAGKATREKGYLAYYEICEKIGVENWAVEKPDPEAVGPFAHNALEWVGYDDEEMAAKKAQYVVDNDLGGIMFWSIDNDDFRGQCTGRKYPLIEAAKAALYGQTLPPISPINAIEDRNSDASTSSTIALIRPSSLRRPTSNSDRTRGPSTTTRRTTQVANQADFNPFTTPEPPTTPESIVDFECKEEGFYPNAKDCKKYFWCLDTAAGMVSHIFTCPAGLHFNKFTDSCDYATNVICKTGTSAPTTTTVKPFLALSTTTTARPTTTRRPTTTTTTTAEPEPLDYVDEIQPQPLSKNAETTPDELQQLLQLITDLGGVDAVKQLLEKNTGSGRGRKEDGQSISLSSAQRQALERVIRPSSTREQSETVQETSTRKARPNSPQYSTLQRRRPGNQTIKIEEVKEVETTTERARPTTVILTEEASPTAQPQVWRRSTYRTTVSDSAHPDHLSMTDNDVMQVAMSGHLLVGSKLTDDVNDIPNRRFTSTVEETSVDDPSVDYPSSDGSNNSPSYDYPAAEEEQTFIPDVPDVIADVPVVTPDVVPEAGRNSDPTTSLEQYFDQQFHNFQMTRLPAVDWSLRSDGHDQTQGRVAAPRRPASSTIQRTRTLRTSLPSTKN